MSKISKDELVERSLICLFPMQENRWSLGTEDRLKAKIIWFLSNEEAASQLSHVLLHDAQIFPVILLHSLGRAG